MDVLEHVIEFIHEAACNKDFDEDNRIGKGGRGSPRENRHLELQNVLNKEMTEHTCNSRECASCLS